MKHGIHNEVYGFGRQHDVGENILDFLFAYDLCYNNIIL